MKRLAGVSSLRVVNLGHGMAAALVAKHFAELGATVHRVGSLAGDPFTEFYPSYRYWRALEREVAAQQAESVFEGADVVIVGGEHFPGLDHPWSAAELAEADPTRIVVELRGYVEGSALTTPAVDLLVQASTGMSWEHYSDRPICFGVPFPTYGQVLTALIGTWAALVERSTSGRGQVVSASMQQGAAMFMAPFWMEASKGDAEFAKIAPKDSNHLIFECADGTYVQIVLGVPQALVKLHRALGIDLPADPDDRGLPKQGAGAGKYFGDMELYAPYVRKLTRDDVVASCVREGIPVAPVLEPGDVWAHEQAHVSEMLVEHDGHRSTGVPIMVEAGHAVSGGAASGQRDPLGPPLAGLRLIDAGSFLAGPYVSKLLGDLGATVTKIEPLGGEPLRGIARTFQIICAGKTTLPLDVKSDFGAEVVRRMVIDADAINYNYRPGVARRMGLDAATLRSHNPDLISVNTTGFGPTGPLALDPAFDMVVQALAGLEVRGGGAGNPPQWYRLPYVDYVCASFGAVAVLMGCFERRTSGTSLDLTTSLFDAALFMASDLVQRPDGTFVHAAPLDSEQLGTHPAEHIYRTGDGWVAISARDDGQATSLAAVLHLQDVLGDRAGWDDAARARIAAATAGQETARLLRHLGEAGVPAVECRADGLQLLKADPAARAAGLLVQREDAVYGTTLNLTGPLVGFSRSRLRLDGLRGASPLGADTRDALRGLGFTEPEIDRAYQDGVVR